MAERVIILGFDGLDPRLCRQWMEAGLLPNLRRLAASGGFRELNTTYPCQSPVAWRTFATGGNPGSHGVFDFLRKIPGSYLPDMATVGRGIMPILKEEWKRYALGGGAGMAGALLAFGAARGLKLTRRKFMAACAGLPLAVAATSALDAWLPREVQTPVNRTGGVPFWALLGRKGVRCKVLRMPVEFPARDYPNCRVLSGLGVPDVRATNGTYTIFTSAAHAGDADTEMGGRITGLCFENNRAVTVISGPPDPLRADGRPLSCALAIRRSGAGVELTLNGRVIRLQTGQWSGWISMVFSSGPLVNLRGRGRFHLLALEPEFRLYLSPVNLDPEHLPPNIRLSSPGAYASGLARANGFYKTLGWPTDTWALTEGQIPDQVYLDDFHETMRMEKAVTLAELAGNDWDCFTAIFTPTDQIQHVFRAGTPRGNQALLDAYQEVDAFVGRVAREFVNRSTTLIILSDHGFHTYDVSVNLNTWLWRSGFLKFRGDGLPQAPRKKLGDLARGGAFWEGVDWSRTYAYAMGLGNIYLNLRGREPEGMVRPGLMARKVLAKLRQGLLAMRDPATGRRPVVRSVYLGGDLYQGKYVRDAADVVVGFHNGFRVSWQTALGGTPPVIMQANNRKWAADHCSLDPANTPGICITNRRFKGGPSCARILGGGAWPSIMDMAPSVLTAFGLPVPDEFEGEALL